jgi:hypothetical protein
MVLLNVKGEKAKVKKSLSASQVSKNFGIY